MIVSSFAMRGSVPVPYSGGGELTQGPLHDDTGPLAVERPAGRTAMAGWIGHAPGRDGSPLGRLQRAIDQEGDRAVRRLRGDFALAHLGEGELSLYRGLSAMVPLFWTLRDGALSWSTDPLDLLPGRAPGLGDVELGLVPMLIAERGFPHERSWFRGVHRLPAGHRLRLSGQRPVVSAFDDFRLGQEPPASLEDAADGLRDRLSAACERVLAGADSAVLMLSGGTDSAVVACEAARHCADVLGFHFTLSGFPGFAQDAESAREVAAHSGIAFQEYDMGRHTVPGGDYLKGPDDRSLPRTHVPLPAYAVTAAEAHARGARFVLTGLMSDQVFMHDWHRGLWDSLGWSTLNPLAAGRPVWQVLGETLSSSFSSGPVAFLRGLVSGDPAAALPNPEILYHHVGLTRAAQERIADSVGESARLIRRQEEEFHGAGVRRRRPSGTAQLFVKEAVNFPHVHTGYLNDLRPRETFLFTPFADRDVVEYLAAVPPEYKLAVGHGAHVDKFLLRHAYAGRGIPHRVAVRMRQARIDAIPATYAHHNAALAAKLLGQDSMLVEHGIVEPGFADRLDPRTVHRMGEPLARLCVIEQWLRGFVR
ncbi:asparagine synthase-related protein [Spongiactinospora sp. 9N601]|uniref:asparagine synthase-related protein n=1 Tax=Spongiactinospora sp. 9N601 TaxID=3375149 RepID=UPI0037B279AA